MTTQQNLSHQRTGPSSTRTHSRSEPKANNGNSNKDIDLSNPKIVLSSSTTFNTPTFEIPAVTTSGMKNIEHLIEKTYIEGKQWYRCKWQHCAYSTIRSDSIVRHMRKHTGHRPYKCLFCSYATIQSSSLKIHLRRTHTGTQAPKLHKCSFSSCRYSSTDHCKLVNHLRKRHQVEPEPINSSLNQVSDQMNAPHPSMHLNGSLYSGSSSHSLALVSGQHLSPTSLVAFPGQNINYQAMLNSNALVPGSHRKANETSLPPAFMPINFLSVLTGSGDTPNANTQDTLNADSDRTRGKSAAQHSKTAKQSGKRYNSVAAALNSQVPREENSIKRIMILVDKRSINNKTSYCCKWPDCGYQTLRSDSIVRHIRSHTGERPFRCLYENCNYATIQRSTLNKHINRHLNSDQT